MCVPAVLVALAPASVATLDSMALPFSIAWQPPLVRDMQQLASATAHACGLCAEADRGDVVDFAQGRFMIGRGSEVDHELGLIPREMHSALPEMCRQAMSENEFMKNRLEMMQNDIDDAIHKGRDMVCWPLN